MLDLKQLVSPVSFPDDDEVAKLLQEKGIEHERAFLETLKTEGKTVAEIPSGMALAEQVALTRAALRQGLDVIYQGAFSDGTWHGYSDFLLKVDRPSSLGDYSYEVADTKLSRLARPKHVIQMGIYSDILAGEQGAKPRAMHIVLGDRSIASVQVDQIIHYFRNARLRF